MLPIKLKAENTHTQWHLYLSPHGPPSSPVPSSFVWRFRWATTDPLTVEFLREQVGEFPRLSRPSPGSEAGRPWGQLYGWRHRSLTLATHRTREALGIFRPV
jgi:hypothetical protein